MVRYDKSTADSGRKYIEDRRGVSPGVKAAGGVGGIGAVLALLFTLLTGGEGGLDTGSFGGAGVQPGGQESASIDPASDPDADTVEYMGFLMQDIQDTWRELFEASDLEYKETKLIVFRGSVTTNGCGNASSAVGPFYCPAPADNNVYIDLGFFAELSDRFGAPGDFAQAYVIAHEIGHHIQSVTNTSDQIRESKKNDPANANSYAILQELQADCYAGVWASSASKLSLIHI